MKALFVSAFFFLASCQQSSSEHITHTQTQLKSAEPNSISKVTVQFVDFGIMTFVGTSCERFNTQFPEAHTIEITDKNTLDSLTSRIALFKKDTAAYSIDIRAKVIIHYEDNATSTLCIDRFNMFFNGSKVFYDKSINKLLRIPTD